MISKRNYHTVFAFSFLLTLTFGLSAFSLAQETKPKPDGTEQKKEVWTGELNLGVSRLRLDLIVETLEDGKEKATLISIDQNNAKIPINAFSSNGKEMTFESKMIQTTFVGKINDQDECVGTFTQRGTDLPLTLKKLSEEAASRPRKTATWEERPQRPKEPLPYLVEEVSVENESAELTLAGTLTMPKTDTPVPAVILVSGSGPQDRDETLNAHKPFLVLADYLTRNGIAVLRYDDRGTAQSTGSFAGATTNDFATDAQAAVAFLATRKNVDAKRIGIIGHSEGGLIGPIVANATDDVAFLVLLAGPGVDGQKIIESQAYEIAKKMGADEEQLNRNADLNARLFRVLRENQNEKSVQIKLFGAFGEWMETLPQDQKAAGRQAAAGVVQMAKPWFRNFIVYDPKPALEKLNVPTLALLGGRDLQVLVTANRQPLEAALAANGVKGNEVVVFDEMNHMFQKAENGLPSEYGKIDETMNPKVMQKMAQWILSHKKKK